MELTRREALIGTAAALLSGRQAIAAPASTSVERWAMYEVVLEGPASGNPFVDITLAAEFRCGDTRVRADGFYDGDGVYRIRFMPTRTGRWTWRTQSNAAALDARTGHVDAMPASGDNHGPVGVRDTYHFGYADGTPFALFGTTCYAWAFQPEAIKVQTLETLARAPFNKLRMGLFPKFYAYNSVEPMHYPFARSGLTNDYTVLNPDYFRNIDRLVAALCALGIEADLILFHPYDDWGYKNMPDDADHRYLKYVAARYSAFRNVWWSLANEYDNVGKTDAQWDAIADAVVRNDPYGHLRSIHNWRRMYDYKRSWCTHACLQSRELQRGAEMRTEWGKPVIFDELEYEGNIPLGWGSLLGTEEVRRHWVCQQQGVYPGHGETFLSADGVLWWSHGGTLKGESPARIGFMRRLIEEALGKGGRGGFARERIGKHWVAALADKSTIAFYLDGHGPAELMLPLPAGQRYRAEYIDTWAMTRTVLPGTQAGDTVLRGLPRGPAGLVWLTALPAA